jgi:hypothetical protein
LKSAMGFSSVVEGKGIIAKRL